MRLTFLPCRMKAQNKSFYFLSYNRLNTTAYIIIFVFSQNKSEKNIFFQKKPFLIYFAKMKNGPAHYSARAGLVIRLY